MFSHLFIGGSWSLREADNRIPFRRRVYRNSTRARVHSFVRPEAPANVVLIQQRPEGSNPLVGVFAGLTHPHRHIVFLAKIQILLNGPLIYVHPVFMKSVDEFCVKGRSKNFEVRVPLCTTKKDDVVTVDLSYAGHNPAIEWLQHWVQFGTIEIMRNWFVE